MIQGYDSWGNINPAPDSMKFVGLCFNDFGNPLRKHYMFDDQYALAKSQGKLVVAYTMWRGDWIP